jgi:hypothetical protein
MAKRASEIISATLAIIFIISTISICAKNAAGSDNLPFTSFLEIPGVTAEEIAALQGIMST